MPSELERQYAAKAAKGESPRMLHMSLLDAYYHGKQYDGMPRSWYETVDGAGQLVPFLQRRPSTILPIARVIVNVFVRALWGAGRRPKATLAGGTDADHGFVDDIVAEARLLRVMTEATRRAFAIGSGLVVWRLESGRLRADAWDAKCATPTFKPNAAPELESVDYRYKFSREDRDAATGHVRTVTYWHRETITSETWTVYKDVEPKAAGEPEWFVDDAKPHGLGFVPAIWFAVGERGRFDFDGTGLYEPFLGLLDEVNYTASQMGRSLYYNLDPQNVVSGVTPDFAKELGKGAGNVWALPPNADAKLLESNGTYITQATERLDLLKKSIFDAAGVVLPDPERVSGAQSGASLELLAAPQVAMVDELRECIGDAYVRLLEQVLTALASESLAPAKMKIDVRDGKPRTLTKSSRVVLTWGTHFPLTASDANQAADAVKKATDAGALSQDAGARFLAPYFGVQDIEADRKKAKEEAGEADKRVVDQTAALSVAEHVRFAGMAGGGPDPDLGGNAEGEDEQNEQESPAHFDVDVEVARHAPPTDDRAVLDLRLS